MSTQTTTSAPVPEAPAGPTAAEIFAAIKLASAREHQRLSAAVQERYGKPILAGSEAVSQPVLVCWQLLISMAREIWDRPGKHSYVDHVRFLAFRDAADAIAKKAIGEA